MKSNDVDLGLSVLCVVSQRDDTLSTKDIADVCGCSRNNIDEIEKRALKKLRAKFKSNNFKLDDFIEK